MKNKEQIQIEDIKKIEQTLRQELDKCNQKRKFEDDYYWSGCAEGIAFALVVLRDNT